MLYLGLTPGAGGLELLPRLAGRSRALEIVIGADDFDADTAAAYGCMSYLFFSLYDCKNHLTD